MEKQKIIRMVISVDEQLKLVIDKKAKQEAIKPATYVKSSLVKYLREQGEDV